ncbi:hypothetical protein QR77_29950 [Streptomyces sp. 150FB]|uniref:hypothetical protein n=1 Tax=Streptomyces sp. 150FB TaxID=1576605 RepID=UPI00058959ED|nr:hypothetical protein [Streptomyces sp. 150FB]KIF76938.1 hypothetical protein QR77_29950 [Streptomyces sp. 150FB]
MRLHRLNTRLPLRVGLLRRDTGPLDAARATRAALVLPVVLREVAAVVLVEGLTGIPAVLVPAEGPVPGRAPGLVPTRVRSLVLPVLLTAAPAEVPALP